MDSCIVTLGEFRLKSAGKRFKSLIQPLLPLFQQVYRLFCPNLGWNCDLSEID